MIVTIPRYGSRGFNPPWFPLPNHGHSVKWVFHAVLCLPTPPLSFRAPEKSFHFTLSAFCDSYLFNFLHISYYRQLHPPPSSTMTTDRDHLQPPHTHTVEIPRRRRKLILCFDGTGNKFKGNAGDTNILKIFRMLDRSGPEQCRFFCLSSLFYSGVFSPGVTWRFLSRWIAWFHTYLTTCSANSSLLSA